MKHAGGGLQGIGQPWRALATAILACCFLCEAPARAEQAPVNQAQLANSVNAQPANTANDGVDSTVGQGSSGSRGRMTLVNPNLIHGISGISQLAGASSGGGSSSSGAPSSDIPLVPDLVKLGRDVG